MLIERLLTILDQILCNGMMIYESVSGSKHVDILMITVTVKPYFCTRAGIQKASTRF